MNASHCAGRVPVSLCVSLYVKCDCAAQPLLLLPIQTFPLASTFLPPKHIREKTGLGEKYGDRHQVLTYTTSFSQKKMQRKRELLYSLWGQRTAAFPCGKMWGLGEKRTAIRTLNL